MTTRSVYDKEYCKFLEQFEEADIKNPYIGEAIITGCNVAAKKSTDAGFSGAWHDGGAGKVIAETHAFVKGYKYALACYQIKE